MATSASAFRCRMSATKMMSSSPSPSPSRRVPEASQVPFRVSAEPDQNQSSKIVLQPRLCTLRSYGSDPVAVVKKSRREEREGGDTASFFEALSEYVESSKNSQDFEIISGRLAMILFAATVTVEVATGNSLFGKVDLQGLEEGGGACLAAVTLAAIFAWFSSARNRVGKMFTLGCNSLIDSLIDQVVDGLFYEEDPNDWSDMN